MSSRRRGRLLTTVLPGLVFIGAGAFAWGLVYDLIVHSDVGASKDFWAMERIVAYGLFILAPALTFMPIARALRIPLYDLEAIVGWSTLAFTFTFIDPGNQPPLSLLLIFLVSLVVALATVFSLISYAIGFRLYARRSQRYDFVRARREGYLAAMFLVGLLLLSMLEVLTAVNAALLGLIVVLLEVLLLSRGTPRRWRSTSDRGKLPELTRQ